MPDYMKMVQSITGETVERTREALVERVDVRKADIESVRKEVFGGDVSNGLALLTALESTSKATNDKLSSSERLAILSRAPTAHIGLILSFGCMLAELWTAELAIESFDHIKAKSE